MSATKTGTAPVQTETPVELTDVKASAQLKLLFSNYRQVKKNRPKSPSEAAAMVLIGLRDPEHTVDGILTPILEAFVVDFSKWGNDVDALLHGINAIGESNPNAAIMLNGKSGRVVQVNGNALFDALLRTEGEILSATLA